MSSVLVVLEIVQLLNLRCNLLRSLLYLLFQFPRDSFTHHTLCRLFDNFKGRIENHDGHDKTEDAVDSGDMPIQPDSDQYDYRGYGVASMGAIRLLAGNGTVLSCLRG